MSLTKPQPGSSGEAAGAPVPPAPTSPPGVAGSGTAPPEVPQALRKPRSGGPRSGADTRAGWLFISPWVLGFLIFTAWPVIYSLYLSFTDYDVLNPPHFIGLENYQTMFSDPKVTLSLRNTFYFTVIQVPLYIIVSLALAMLLNKAVRASGFFRTAFYLPKMTPPVAAGILLLLLFNGQSGLINTVLGWFGFSGPSWTTDPAWVKPGIILLTLWSVGSSVIIFLAALRNVPQELYDSAKVDGASSWQQTMKVTVPLISPTIFFLTIVHTIAAFQTFTEAYTAYFGAGNTTYSNDAALFYSIYLFQQAFQFLHMGYASALAWLLFVIIMIFSMLQLWASKRFVYYEGDQR